jgi:prophage tail gpP-like protein
MRKLEKDGVGLACEGRVISGWESVDLKKSFLDIPKNVINVVTNSEG